MSGIRSGALAATLALLLSALWWSQPGRPAFAILLAWGAAAVVAALPPGPARGPAVACAAGLIALALAEGGLELRSLWRKRHESRPVSSAAADPVLGWRQRPGPFRDGPRVTGSQTIGPTGFRPGSSKAAADAPVVLILGDSFAYGFHLPDTDTMPYVLEERLGGRLDVVDLAMTGWGPHQSLALLESGLDRTLTGRRRVVYGAYFSLVDAFRPTGQRHWSRRGPWYTLGPEGLRLNGDLADREPFREELARRTALGERVGKLFWPNRADPALYAALLSRIGALFARRYHVPLTFILAPGSDVPAEPLLARLRAEGAGAVLYASLFSGGDVGNYELPDDGHPNPAGAARVAEYLAGEIERLGSAPAAGPVTQAAP